MGAVEKALIASEPYTSAADEPRILCIIQNTLNAGNRLTHNWPMSMTCGQLFTEVAKELSVQANSIELYYQPPNTDSSGEQQQVNVNAEPNKTIGELCCGGNHRNSFFVCNKEGCCQSSISNDAHSNIISETTVSAIDNKDSYSNDTYASNTSAGSSSYSYASAVMKSDTGYVGLVNQAMTCYLNSLLQTLYMTPEFRNAVYRWEYDGSDGETMKSIPCQLQRLFLQLQTSTKRAVETTDITRSFGWDSSDAWQQHDVQELCRVMFDALEKSWKNTDQSNLITQLYQGKIKDYVKCLKCGSESARTDTYLDIPLVVRPFGANVGYSSVEEALRAFVEYETLDGTNQYFCEKCNCKSDAHKGLKFLTFPYLLTLQLKRFDFDYSTMHRIKLNDRMSFPERLSLGQFIDTENESMAPMKEAGDVPVVCADGNECGDSGSAGSNTDEVDEGIDIGDTASGTTASRSPSDFSDAGRHRKMGRSNDLEPFVYELFSIMVHSGGASGGHYYAYIKSFKDLQWYSFNDQHVYRIAQDDIEKTFGGSSFSSGYYSSYSSSANAYMLMYRQVDPTRNKQFMQLEDFPPHLLSELEHLKHKDEEEQLQREIEKNTCKIKLYHFDDNTQRYVESKLEVHKTKTLQEATEIAWRLLRPPGIKLGNFRLVKFDSIHEYIERSFDNELATPISQVLGGVKSVYSFDLLAETKFSNEEFVSYSCGDVMVRVNIIDLDKESIEPALTVVRISPQQTVGELKQLIASTLHLPAETMKCVVEKYYNQLYLLGIDTRTLHSESFQKTNKVFVECSGVEDDVHFSDSRLFAVLDRHQHTIRMTINVPKMPVSYKKMYLPKTDDIADHDGGVIAAIADVRSTEMDEGIGESETDVLSTADIDSCPPSVVSAPSTGFPVAGSPEPSKTPPNLESSPILTDIYSVGSSERPLDNGDDAMKFPPPVTRIHDQLFVDTSITDEQHLAAASAGGISDDHVDEVSPTFVSSVSHSLSQDSGSSQTVEVGDDVRSPSSGDEDFDGPRSKTPSPQPASPSSPAFSLADLLKVPACSAAPADSTTSPEMDNVKDASTTKESSENWDQDTINMKADDELVTERDRYNYCRVDKTVFPLGCERTLIARVDRRISLKTLKASLEEYVGVTSNNFKVYKVSQSGQEIEETRLSDTLINYPNDAQITIKYGRALQSGEHRVQVYQLVINDPEPMKLKVEVILARGMTVLDAKKVIVDELLAQQGMNVDIARCRLRRKNWRMPSHIYTNNSATLEESLGNALNPELLLEVLEEEERLPSERKSSQLSLYIRRWRPSKYVIEAFQEIYLNDLSLDETLFKISAASGIPVDDLCFAKPKGTFPYDISVLEVEKELEWNPNVSLISQWPLSVVDDGSVLFYKDRTEELMELSDEQKKQLQQKENSRLMKQNSSSVSFTHRKERALKIYTADSPATSAPSAAQSSKTVTVSSVSELILD